MEMKDRSTRVKAPTHSTSDVAAKSGDSTSRDNDDMFQTRKEEASPMAETEETRNSCIAKERSIWLK